jgi:hypothetical protein
MEAKNPKALLVGENPQDSSVLVYLVLFSSSRGWVLVVACDTARKVLLGILSISP